VINEEVLGHIESKRKRSSYVQQKVGSLTGLVTSCVGTVFSNTLLKERYWEKVLWNGGRGRIQKRLLNDAKKRKDRGNLKTKR
jgi:hypothetical protein